MPSYGPPVEAFTQGTRIARVPVLIIEANAALTKDQKPYGRYVFKDRTGVVNGIRWDHAVAEGEVGSVALLGGNVEEYRGQPQVRVLSLDLLDEPPADLLERLTSGLPAALLTELTALLEDARATLPPVFWRLFELSLGHDPFDLEADFWTYAAAQSKHHAERGGLAWHTLTMYRQVEAIAAPYPKLDVPLLKLAVLCHDLGKIDCYQMGAAGARQLESDRIIGHTSYSMQRVYHALQLLRAEGGEFSREDEEALLHCIAGHHGRLDWGAVREPASAEAAALHALDLLDSQIRGLADKRSALPLRDTAPAPVPVAAADPFQLDDDDPFDEPGAAFDEQPSLF